MCQATAEPRKRKNPGRTGCPTKILEYEEGFSNNHLCADDVAMVVSKKTKKFVLYHTA
jgi:hypothetical protein